MSPWMPACQSPSTPTAHGTCLWGQVFGAPLAAGIWVDRAGGCATTATGNASPILYQLAADGAVGGGFNDITSGNNDLTGNNAGKYTAGAGYDLASGLGSMIAGGVTCTEVGCPVLPSQGPRARW